MSIFLTCLGVVNLMEKLFLHAQPRALAITSMTGHGGENSLLAQEVRHVNTKNCQILTGHQESNKSGGKIGANRPFSTLGLILYDGKVKTDPDSRYSLALKYTSYAQTKYYNVSFNDMPSAS